MALTVVDASVVIAVLESTDAHHGPATEAVRAARSIDRAQLVLPSTAYAEVLVYPERAGAEVAAKIRAFCAQEFILESVTPSIAEAAARLRARHASLRLPDALVIATAECLHADALLTADVRWKAYFPGVTVLE
jgi:predicted nucleic acid-binding protein